MRRPNATVDAPSLTDSGLLLATQRHDNLDKTYDYPRRQPQSLLIRPSTSWQHQLSVVTVSWRRCDSARRVRGYGNFRKGPAILHQVLPSSIGFPVRNPRNCCMVCLCFLDAGCGTPVVSIVVQQSQDVMLTIDSLLAEFFDRSRLQDSP